MTRGFSKGLYKCRHPEKYVGNLQKIIYRSSWELSFCQFCDNNPRVIEWASEPFGLPYISPIDKKIHKYYPDFLISYVDKNGEIFKELVEIKPSTQISQPKIKGKKPKQQLYESITYAVNIAKWKSATEFCQAQGIKFRLLSELSMFK